MTSPKLWDRHDILAALRRREYTFDRIADEYNVKRHAFNNIWSRPHQAAERAIADVIGLPVEVVFWKRYPKTRNRICPADYKPGNSRNKPASSSRRDVA